MIDLNGIVYKCSSNHIKVIRDNGKQDVICHICKEVMQPVGTEIITKESK